MNFHTREGNFIKSDNTTSKMMKHLFIALIPIILFTIYKNGILPMIKGYQSVFEFFHLLLLLIIPAFTCLLTEYIWYRFILKEKHSWSFLLTSTYSMIPGIFLSLIIPIHTPIYIAILGSLFASIMGKLMYNGFGNNIFNPALMGRLFVIASYASVITSAGGYLNAFESHIDSIAGATPLTNLGILNYVGSYSTIVGKFGSIWDFLIGNIPGAIGETSSLLIIAAFLYLAIKKVIKWRIPVYYLTTVFIVTLVIALTNHMGLWYSLFHLFSGGLLFGAVFMATDPVTSPLTKNGQIFYGISLGCLTIIFRFLTPYPEGVCISILIMNLLLPWIKKLEIESNTKKKLFPYLIGGILLLTMFFMIVISIRLPESSPENNQEDPSFHILEKKKNGMQTEYLVTGKGFGGNNSYKVKIIFQNDYIMNIEVLDHKETYFDLVENNNYINKIITNQKNLENLDTVSGATYSSKFLKELVEKTIKDYQKSK